MTDRKDMTVLELSNELLSVIDSMQAKLLVVTKRQSELDTELSDFYHALEVTNFNPFQAYQILSHLKGILARRRENKTEVATMQSMNDSINIHVKPLRDRIRKVNTIIKPGTGIIDTAKARQTMAAILNPQKEAPVVEVIVEKQDAVKEVKT